MGYDCGMCGGRVERRVANNHEFVYDGQEIVVDLPYKHCPDCGFEYTDHEGEVVKDRAIWDRLMEDVRVELRRRRDFYFWWFGAASVAVLLFVEKFVLGGP